MLILNIIRSLRMRTQVLLIQVVMIILLIMVLLIIYQIHLSILNDQLFYTSNILISKQNSKTMQITASKLADYIQNSQKIYLAAINSVNELYQFPNSTSDFNIEIPEYILDANSGEQFTHLNKFRFGILNKTYQATQQNSQYQLQFMQLTSLLNSHLFCFDASINSLYVSDTSDAVFSITYPPIVSMTTDQFDPRKLDQYLEFLKFIDDNPTQHYFYSQIYQSSFNQQFQTDLMRKLISTEQKLDAVIGTFIKLSDHHITDVPYNIYIINSEDGSIIIAGLDVDLNLNQKYFIYDTDVSGFDFDDWQQMQEQISNQNGKSNCHFSSNILCRFNKLYKIDVLISMEQFSKLNQTLLIVNNATYQTSLETVFDEIMSKAIIDQEQQLQTQLFVSGVLTIISIIIITIIFRPLQKIIQASNNQIKLRSTRYVKDLNVRLIKLKKISKETNIFNNLQQKYEQFLDKIADTKVKKSEICRLIEKFKYQQRQYSIENRWIQEMKWNFDRIEDKQMHLALEEIINIQRRVSRTNIA